jgi:hypothetical protein
MERTMTMAKATLNNITPSRRTVLAGAAALPALAAPSIVQATAKSPADHELQRLWSKFQAEVAAHEAAAERMRGPRAAYDAAEPPRPVPMWVPCAEHDQACRRLWELHDLDALWAEWNAAFDCHLLTLKEIREAKAETLHGVAIKLAAIRRETDDTDYLDAMHDALSAADRILATDFVAVLPDLYWLEEDQEEAA